jgi:cytochrome c oxidase cbb3-type subunit 3
MAGRYQLTASTWDKSHKNVELKVEEIALGYQQTLGRRLNDQYCERCHNPESTVERVSNYDNLEVKPHPFTEGDTLNKISDADLAAIITHGGAALNKSALMPAWGNTLSKSDIQALISYIRAISDPPSRSAGLCQELVFCWLSSSPAFPLPGHKCSRRTKSKIQNCARYKSATWMI